MKSESRCSCKTRLIMDIPQTASDVSRPLMAPYLKANAADMRLQGETCSWMWMPNS